MGTRGFVGYKHKDKIKGWYNHNDSYPDGLGENVIEAVKPLTLKQLKDFFLNRVTLVDDDNYYQNHRDVMGMNWAKESVTLQDGKNFYKNGLFCEYSYIIDLDAPVKTLLFFRGFGKGPSKGYEDWCSSNEIHYMIAHDPILLDDHAVDWINSIVEKYDYKDLLEEEKENEILIGIELLDKVKASKKEDLPLFISELSAAKETASVRIAKMLMEKKLKEESG